MLANCYVSIHTRPHPSSDARRRIEVGGLCFPVNRGVAKKDDEADALLSNPNTPPEGEGFRPARKFDEGKTPMMTKQTLAAGAVMVSVLGLSACVQVSPWQRGTLAKPAMAIDPTPMQTTLSEHTHGSREAASASSSASGGGCGCY